MPSTTDSSNSIKRIFIVLEILPNSMKNKGVLFLKVYIQTDISKNNISKSKSKIINESHLVKIIYQSCTLLEQFDRLRII